MSDSRQGWEEEEAKEAGMLKGDAHQQALMRLLQACATSFVADAQACSNRSRARIKQEKLTQRPIS